MKAHWPPSLVGRLSATLILVLADADNRVGAGVGQLAGTLLRDQTGAVLLVGADGELKSVTAPGLDGLVPKVPTTLTLGSLGEYRLLSHHSVVVGLPEEPTDRSITTAICRWGAAHRCDRWPCDGGGYRVAATSTGTAESPCWRSRFDAVGGTEG